MSWCFDTAKSKDVSGIEKADFDKRCERTLGLSYQEISQLVT